MITRNDAVFLTGGSGLVGSHAISRLLATRPELHCFVLTRDLAGWRSVARRRQLPRGRVTPVEGDVTAPALGLDRDVRDVLGHRVREVIHAAADTTFSRPLDEARAVNTDGTARVAELARTWGGLRRFVYVSTAFVAGRLEGRVPERHNDPVGGFVNGYEQSKYEAEAWVRASGLPWVIVRPSAIACDGSDGRVTQFNAVHRALRLFHDGLASMMPGDESNLIDVVPTDWVADCVAHLVTAPGVEGGTFHACTGTEALPLGRSLDEAYEVWSESPQWRRRDIPRPAFTDLETYGLFERTVEETGDARLRAICRSLSHFVPQLALPKVFDTSAMEAVMGRRPPEASSFWRPMIRYLTRSRWAAEARRAA